MKTKELDIQSLKDATEQLKLALEFSTSELAKSDIRIFEQFRNSTVQCFEYTFELGVKMMRRYLESTSDNPSEVDELEFKDMIRVSAIKGLVEEPTDWFEFRKMRNLSSHAYDRSKAEAVYRKSPDLLNASIKLIAVLDSRVKK